ncbi:hypothetical protein IMSHALPRED_001697 [Imshaugia aleurites]|uniref:Uncharacterized protein n=1 Tax=Imshaugia aleurites TaxID=172621 RepID=A0A8H3J3D7_9LECA|nr:hypothetical protein IMSHALPRED_001697 [Imshaugia aleurites]
MTEPTLDSSFVRQILHNLSSYSVAGKIAVITGTFDGIDRVVAHVCVWARMSHIILVGPQECTLKTVKAHLKVTVHKCGSSARIHAHTADLTDIDQIASIFFGVRRRVGIPDLLILCTPSGCPSKPVHEYTIEDIIQHLDVNEKSKKGFIGNFLTPGTRKRKTLVDLSIIVDHYLPESMASGKEIKAHRYFWTCALKKDREWALTFHDILHGLVATKKLGEKLERRSQAWVFADSTYTAAGCKAKTNKIGTVDPACRLALWRLPEKAASRFESMIFGDESVLEQAKAAQIHKQQARIVNILPNGGGR